jgi:hypothetical protein
MDIHGVLNSDGHTDVVWVHGKASAVFDGPFNEAVIEYWSAGHSRWMPFAGPIAATDDSPVIEPVGNKMLRAHVTGVTGEVRWEFIGAQAKAETSP